MDQVGANNTVAAKLRVDGSAQGVILQSRLINNNQSEDMKATEPKVWKRRDRARG